MVGFKRNRRENHAEKPQPAWDVGESGTFYDPLGAILQALADWVENGGNVEAAGAENRFEGAVRKEQTVGFCFPSRLTGEVRDGRMN
jgi:hypothetical protein